MAEVTERDREGANRPEASKLVGHEFNSTARPWVKFADEQDTCRICGLPWSKHGGRDAR